MQAAWIPALLALAAISVALFLARKQLAGLAAHGRDMIRHLLALVLMAGTLAGTVWTFSAGQLTLSGALERLTSVGGIALALEIGAIYCGWYIGQLDMRIQATRRRELAEEMRELRDSLYRWFYATVAISAIANFLFRVQQLHNLPLAAFVSAAPVVLIILFTIKLRPLPTDYADIGRQATQRGLVVLAEQSSQVLQRGLLRMGQGDAMTPAELQQLGLAAAFLRTYARPEEQHALDYAIQQQAPALGTGAGVVDGSAEIYLTTGDIAQLYGISQRTAQMWIANTPGRKRGKGNAWTAPAAAIYAQQGLPTQTAPQLTAPQQQRTRRTRRADMRTQSDAGAGNGDAAPAPDAEVTAQLPEGLAYADALQAHSEELEGRIDADTSTVYASSVQSA